MTLPITAQIDGRQVSREDIRAWERTRAEKVARRLGVTGTRTDLERRLVERKLALGHAGIERLLARRLAVSERVGRAGAALSRGRRRLSSVVLTSPAGIAELVPGWYADTIGANDEVPLIAACPDHYLSRTNPDGTQEIIETTGGAPLPVRMLFDDADTGTITTPADPAFPRQWVSRARAANGTAIGGVRHQFRDRDGGGFHIRLTVEFPMTTAPFMIAAHRWHLACEFSNWIETVNDVAP